MKKYKVVVSLLIACMLLLPVFTHVAKAAEEVPDGDLTGNTEFLIIHNTTEPYTGLGGPSVITVTEPGGAIKSPTVTGPDEITYSDIPNGSTIDLTFGFDLLPGEEPYIYTYKGDNFFYINLPLDITFNITPGVHEIYANDKNGTSWLFGTWSWSSTDPNRIRVDFDDSTDFSLHSEIWGQIGLNGTFDDIDYGDIRNRQLVLGTKTVVFYREEQEKPAISVEKEGVYNAADNTIDWTVIVTPPDGWGLDGFTLVDEYCKDNVNQSFVDDSFYVGTTQIINTGSTPDLNLVLDTTNYKVSYTFPDTDPDVPEITAAQTIRYKTRPTTFSAETGVGSAEQSVFANYAKIMFGTEDVTAYDKAEVSANWISKAGLLQTGTDGSIIIRWTVDIAVPYGGEVTNGKINDTIPAGLQLIKDDSSHPIQITPYGGTATTIPENSDPAVWGAYTYAYADVDHESYFEYRFPTNGTVSNSAKVVYYTKLTSRDHDLITNNEVYFSNHAEFSWDKVPVSTDPPRDNARVRVVGTDGLLSKTAGGTTEYNHQTGDFIHWTTTVNRNKVTMPNAYIMDVVPAGQKLVIGAEHLFTVKKGTTPVFSGTTDSHLTSTDSGFTYTFPDENGDDLDGIAINDTYTVEYDTQIQNVAEGLGRLYVNNNSVGFSNGVKLYFGGSLQADINRPKNFSSQMIAKSTIPASASDAYDYTTHTVKWQIVVNRNRMQLSNGYVTDTLPAGMELLIDATHPFTVSGSTTATVTNPSGITSGNTSFTYDLPSSTTDQFTFTFFTLLQDDQLKTEWSGTKSFTNRSRLYATQISTYIEATSSVAINNPVITKNRSYTAGDDFIDWTVDINTGLITMHNAYVTDVLNTGLKLDTASLKLYEVNVKTNGDIETPGTLVTEGYTVQYPTADNANTLTVHLPEGGRKAYRLMFTTFIIVDDLNFTNEVSLSGATEDPVGDDDADAVVVNNLWATAGSGSQQLTVYKDDGKGHPVPGSKYQLLNFNKEPIIKGGSPIYAITDASGNAVFRNLPAWVFYAKEVSAPDGFLLNPDVIGGERAGTDTIFTTADPYALGVLSFNKTTHKGAALSGGEFTLTGTAYDGSDVTMKASSVSGKVTFSDVPIGTYTIRETRAPAGFYVSDTVLTATVSYADVDRLAVKSEISADKIVDQPIPGEHFGSIGLKKTDETGRALSGAVFGLFNSDGVLAQQVVSQSDGTVTFSHVTLGTYTIKEITPPAGYLASTRVITATIEDDGDIIDGGTFSNKTIYGSVRIVKTTEDGKTFLPGAQLSLFKKGGTEIVARGISGADGVVVFENLLYGDYVIRETKAPDGYALSALEVPVSVKEDGKVVDAGSFVNSRVTESPKTGDDIMKYFVLALCSMAGIAVVYVISKRIKKIS